MYAVSNVVYPCQRSCRVVSVEREKNLLWVPYRHRTRFRAHNWQQSLCYLSLFVLLLTLKLDIHFLVPVSCCRKSFQDHGCIVSKQHESNIVMTRLAPARVHYLDRALRCFPRQLVHAAFSRAAWGCIHGQSNFLVVIHGADSAQISDEFVAVP